MSGPDTNRGAKRARELRAELGLEPAAPVRCILDLVESRLGIPVVIAPLPATIDGGCSRHGAHALLFVNGTHRPERQRFTLAHELGHVRLGHREHGRALVTVGGKATTTHEVQANAFAAELLAPADGVRRCLDGRAPTLSAIVAMAANFGISPIAATFRLKTLGLADTAALQHAIEQGHATPLASEHAGGGYGDAIEAITARALPRLSPSLRGSALAAVLRGELEMRDAALAAGCGASALRRAVHTIDS